MAQEEYKVELDVFEGPLDLLLYLIRKDEVDIYNIPIETITSQYMEYLNLMRMLDLNIAGEFIVMAATLMMIKSRMLLPVEERPELEKEEEDPRWDLVRQLVEYKKFKDAAAHLEHQELFRENIFDLGRSTLSLDTEKSEILLDDVSLFDLMTAFNEVLKNARSEEIREISGERFTVADKIAAILHAVRSQEKVKFVELFGRHATKNEVLCTFLGLLELIRLRQVQVIQKTVFGDILLCATEDTPAAGRQEADAPDVAEEVLSMVDQNDGEGL